jgi:1-deoxy-D-xylulose-5-phosphate reductoisomerase
VIEATLDRLGSQPIRAFETLYEADREARSVAGELLAAHA